MRQIMSALTALTLMAGGACQTNQGAEHLVSNSNAAADARSREVVLNILRASEGLPPSFTAVSSLSKQKSNTGVGTLQIPFGVDAADIFQLNGTGLSQGAEGAVTSVLQTEGFYTGISSPIAPEQYDAITRTGIPVRPVLHLLIDRVSVEAIDPNRPVGVDKETLGIYWNKPSSGDSYKTFLSWLEFLAVEPGGLTTCSVVKEGGVVAGDEVMSQVDISDVGQLSEAYSAGLVVRNDGEGGVQLVERGASLDVQYCTDTLTLAPLSGPLPKNLRLEQSSNGSGRAGVIDYFDTENNVRVGFVVRSVLSMFNYLGDIVANDNSDMPVMDETGRHLFSIVESAGNGPVSVDYKGETYTLDGRTTSYSPATVAILTQLLALNQSADSLPQAGLVDLDRDIQINMPAN